MKDCILKVSICLICVISIVLLLWHFQRAKEEKITGIRCPKCQSSEIIFKPNPRIITIKREIGATVEITGEWFC